jgi:hypothetical protein
MADGEVVVYESKRKVVKQFFIFLGLSVLCGGICVAMYFGNLYSVKLIGITVVAVLCSVWFGIKVMLPAGVMLRLSPDGITQKKTFGERMITWQDVAKIEIKLDANFEKREVCIVPVSGEAVKVSETYLPGTPEELISVLNQYRENVTGIKAPEPATPTLPGVSTPMSPPGAGGA